MSFKGGSHLQEARRSFVAVQHHPREALVPGRVWQQCVGFRRVEFVAIACNLCSDTICFVVVCLYCNENSQMTSMYARTNMGDHRP